MTTKKSDMKRYIITALTIFFSTGIAAAGFNAAIWTKVIRPEMKTYLADNGYVKQEQLHGYATSIEVREFRTEIKGDLKEIQKDIKYILRNLHRR